MRLGHPSGRTLSLLAAGALQAEIARDYEPHLERCPDCRGDIEALRASLAFVAEDSVKSAEPSLSVEVFRTRVEAGLRSAAAPARAARPFWASWLIPAALAGAAALVVWLSSSPRPRPGVPSQARQAEISEEFLARLERTAARESAARYLGEAQDVLLAVASTAPRTCALGRDVTTEASRSRELLVRRTLVMDEQNTGVSSAPVVLADVERMLRDVASLDGCAPMAQLEALHRELREGRVLMKIDLMRRDLTG
ncbi:MAG TPA: hypothetical protein VGB13_11485 [Candidatus Krumholzibacteria bacterium]|jgi:hypothetical protein